MNPEYTIVTLCIFSRDAKAGFAPGAGLFHASERA